MPRWGGPLDGGVAAHRACAARPRGAGCRPRCTGGAPTGGAGGPRAGRPSSQLPGGAAALDTRRRVSGISGRRASRLLATATGRGVVHLGGGSGGHVGLPPCVKSLQHTCHPSSSGWPRPLNTLTVNTYRKALHVNGLIWKKVGGSARHSPPTLCRWRARRRSRLAPICRGPPPCQRSRRSRQRRARASAPLPRASARRVGASQMEGAAHGG